MPAANPTTETKTRKPPKLFTVTGDELGIRTEVSASCLGKIAEVVSLLNLLAEAGNHFPRAAFLADELQQFFNDPTAKVEQKA